MADCRHIKENNEPCMAKTMQGSDYCFFHDPAMALKRAKARKLGGKNRRVARRTDVTNIQLEGIDDIQKTLEDALNDAIGLQSNTHARARTIGYLCGIAIKAFEIGSLEDRLKSLEDRLNQ